MNNKMNNMNYCPKIDFQNKFAVLYCELGEKYSALIEKYGDEGNRLVQRLGDYFYRFKHLYELEGSVTEENFHKFSKCLHAADHELSYPKARFAVRTDVVYVHSAELREALHLLKDAVSGEKWEFNGLYHYFKYKCLAGWQNENRAHSAIRILNDLIAIWSLPEKDSKSEPENDPKITETNDSEITQAKEPEISHEMNNILTLYPNLKTRENTPETKSFIFRNKFASYLCELARKYENIIAKNSCSNTETNKAFKVLFEFRDLYVSEGSVTEENFSEFSGLLSVMNQALLSFVSKHKGDESIPGIKAIVNFKCFVLKWYLNFHSNLDWYTCISSCEEYWNDYVTRKQKTKKLANWIPSSEEIQTYWDEQVYFAEGVINRRIHYSDVFIEEADLFIEASPAKFEKQVNEFYKLNSPEKITETNDSENNSPINSDSEITPTEITTEEPKTELQQKHQHDGRFMQPKSLKKMNFNKKQMIKHFKLTQLLDVIRETQQDIVKRLESETSLSNIKVSSSITESLKSLIDIQNAVISLYLKEKGSKHFADLSCEWHRNLMEDLCKPINQTSDEEIISKYTRKFSTREIKNLKS